MTLASQLVAAIDKQRFANLATANDQLNGGFAVPDVFVTRAAGEIGCIASLCGFMADEKSCQFVVSRLDRVFETARISANSIGFRCLGLADMFPVAGYT